MRSRSSEHSRFTLAAPAAFPARGSRLFQRLYAEGTAARPVAPETGPLGRVCALKKGGVCMPNASKEARVVEIKERFNAADAVIMADYRGLTVKEMQALRVKLREVGCDVRVYKNSLTEIAIRELALPNLDEFLEGPTAFVFVEGDPVTPAKTLTTFAKDHVALELKGGLVANQVVGLEGVKAIATLPSREELLAKLLGTIQNPLRGTVQVLAGPARAFVTVVDAIAKQKAA